MRRLWVLALVALLVVPLLIEAVGAVWTAFADPTVAHWLEAAAGAVQLGLAVMLAILVLRVTRPPRLPLWLPDWRALGAWHRTQHARIPPEG